MPEQEKESVNLDGLAYRVGQGLSERYIVNLFHDHYLQGLSLKVILSLKHPPPHHCAMGYRCCLLRLRFDSEDRNGFHAALRNEISGYDQQGNPRR
jgi:hypothetical protein